MNTTLIMSAQDMKNITSVSDNVDVELLTPFIFNASVLYIKPILSQPLYDDVLNTVATGGTRYDTLLQGYVWYALAYYAWYNASIFMHVKTQKKGLMLQASEQSTNIDMETFTTYSKRIESMASSYATMLREYLEANKDLYPLYISGNHEVDNSGHSIFLGFGRNTRKGYDPQNGSYI